MTVGLLTIDLRLLAADSLKDKRQVVRSLVDRLKHRLNVSVAQVDENDHHRSATLAVACVANDRQFVDQVLQKALRLVESEMRAEVVASRMEML